MKWVQIVFGGPLVPQYTPEEREEMKARFQKREEERKKREEELDSYGEFSPY